MAFAQARTVPTRIGVSAATAPAPPTSYIKPVSSKDLKRLRRSLSEKVENTQDDMQSAFGQLRALGEAFDTLSHVLVDEIDATRSEISRTKIDLSDQVAVLAKGLQTLTPEVANLRVAATENVHCVTESTAAVAAVQKLRQWTESGFRRLNEAMSVQQQALTLVDAQLSSMQEKIDLVLEMKADINACRQEMLDRQTEYERLRAQVLQISSSQDTVMTDITQQLRTTQSAVYACEAAIAERDQKWISQARDYERIEGNLQDLHLLHDKRINALESSRSRDNVSSSLRPDHRITDIEAEFDLLKKQMQHHDVALKQLQHQMQQSTDKHLLGGRAEQQQLQDAVTTAVHDFFRRNPVLKSSNPLSSPFKGNASVANCRNIDTQDGGFQINSSFDGTGGMAQGLDGAEDAFLSPGVFSGALGRVMQDSQRRVVNMRLESEQRHAALTRAVEEIDARIRNSAK